MFSESFFFFFGISFFVVRQIDQFPGSRDYQSLIIRCKVKIVSVHLHTKQTLNLFHQVNSQKKNNLSKEDNQSVIKNIC